MRRLGRVATLALLVPFKFTVVAMASAWCMEQFTKNVPRKLKEVSLVFRFCKRYKFLVTNTAIESRDSARSSEPNVRREIERIQKSIEQSPTNLDLIVHATL